MPRRLQLEGECLKPCCPCCPVGTVKAAKKVLRFVDVAEGSRRLMLLLFEAFAFAGQWA